MSCNSNISGSGAIQLVKLSVLRLGTVDGPNEAKAVALRQCDIAT